MGSVLRQGQQKQEGFTLIELMVAVGIISIIAGTVITALSPRRQLLLARDTMRRHDARELKHAMYQHLLDTSQLAGRGAVWEGAENAKPICKESVSNEDCDGVGGVSLLVLPPEYIALLPVDPAVRIL